MWILRIEVVTARLSSEKVFPYVFVGDEAFQLTAFMIKHYPRELLSLEERIINYRFSRARRIIENTFWIATAHFRRLFIVSVDVAVNVTKAVALHCTTF